VFFLFQVSFEDDIKKTFLLFDKNGDGYITVKELKRVLSCLKICLSDGEIQSILRESDFDKDGRVSYEEFLFLVKSK
jgi:calmodulin